MLPARIDFRAAIESQPGWLAGAADLARTALDGHAPRVIAPHETIAIVAMGASTHAGSVFVHALAEHGVRAINLDASAVARFPAGFRPADHVVIISESGRSPEPIAAAERLGVTPIVITADVEAPAAGLGDIVLPLGTFADSGVYTIGYTTTLVALGALAQWFGVPLVGPGMFDGPAASGGPVALGGAAGLDESVELDGVAGLDGPAMLAEVAADALAAFAAPAREVAQAWRDRHFVDLVGQGTSVGSAQAAALLLREAPGVASAAWETYQYLHGPMECAGAHSAALVFGTGREDALATQLRAAGAAVAQVAVGAGGPVAGGAVSSMGAAAGIYTLTRPVTGYASAIAEIVFAQLVTAELAAARGVAVGKFRYPQSDTKLPE
jgi:fructoselysine-6-P-deglycase FrlB-like protein